eukprot:1931364-Amphidinium_carterae.1
MAPLLAPHAIPNELKTYLVPIALVRTNAGNQHQLESAMSSDTPRHQHTAAGTCSALTANGAPKKTRRMV